MNKKNTTLWVVVILILGACSTPPKMTKASIEDFGLAQSDFDIEEFQPIPTNLQDETLDTREEGELTISSESVSSIGAVGLNEAEAAGLIYMREEEKLAGDVYHVFYETWGLPIFQNISQSEQTHTQAVKILLDHYNLPDSVNENPIGIFSNQDLQSLYDQLVEEGTGSLSDALRVGAAIEEIDILDLEAQLNLTDHAELKRVYTNLLQGSINHLISFTTTLERQTGEVYQPVYMDEIDTHTNISGNRSGGSYQWGRSR